MTPPAPRDWTRGEAGIVAYHCQACEEKCYFERGFCPCCGGRDVTPVQSRGAGIVLARTVIHRAPREALRTCLPYTLVLVQLEEGFAVMGHGDPALRIGDPVRADFVAFGDIPTIPHFKKRDDQP